MSPPTGRRRSRSKPRVAVTCYSPLSDSIGSTRDARRAGRYAASRPTSTIPPATAAKVAGSSAPTPNRRLRSARVDAAATASPMSDPHQQHPRPLPHHHPLHPPRLRAERHAHADLPGPLGDDVRQHPVLPHGAEDDGEQGDHAQRQHGERERQPRVGGEPRHGVGPVHRRAGRHLAHQRPDLGRDRLRPRRLHHVRRGGDHPVGGRLPDERIVDRRRRRVAEVVLHHVFHHADDGLPDGDLLPLEPPPDRRLPRPEQVRRRAVDDHVPQVGELVRLGERPAREQPDPHGREVVARDRGEAQPHAPAGLARPLGREEPARRRGSR